MTSSRRIFKQDEYRETGFGNRVIEENQRLMNKDGSSNVKRSGLSFFAATNHYHSLITMPWWKFNIIILTSYFSINFIFALIYYFGDISHVNGMIYSTEFEKFMEVFYFSAQSLTTVGYGRLNPVGYFNSSVAVVESFIGLLGFALATGLLYGRFSRPVANILFSKNAIIAPFEGFTAIMIRLANKNKSELIDPEVTLVMSFVENDNGKKVRRFSNLKLELTRITILTMSWTIVHPIDEESPIYGWTEEEFLKKEIEFLIYIRAYEETFAQTVHSRSSYRFNELIFGARFISMVKPSENGTVVVELNKINEYESVPLFEKNVLANLLNNIK
jgi:inward rectifier potassium channel